MTSTFLLELGCEDLPARYVLPLANALTQGMTDGLKKRGLAVGASRIYATPRRIAALIENVALTQPDQNIERLGPALAAAQKDGKPTPAALGFAKSCGVEFSALGQKDGKLHFSRTAPGRATRELIPEILEETLKQMDEMVPKRMRWGSGEETFVRPVQWMCCLLGEQVVPVSRFGLESGRLTYGHRFHAPDAISLKSPDAYEASLKQARVWADAASRKTEIRRQIEALGAKLSGHVRISEDLLDEVTALVEWPVAIAGQFEESFLELPPEVIVATVETNQRYFTVFKDAAKKQLTQHFITVSNIESRDVQQVISGNERVVRPRLSDAMFFWEQDLKQPLAAYSDKLVTVTFQKELGTTASKVARIVGLTKFIELSLRNSHAKSTPAEIGVALNCIRAADLCKNDLVTKMVYEFPELQGLMGGYYAEKSGEPAAVAKAIREHYLPTQQGTPIPSTKEGQIVALADKLDTLAGIFAIGQKPTASKDPYALRRAALGVLRICIEGELPLDVAALLKAALDQQPAGKRDAATLKDLTDFVFERLRAYYADLPAEQFEAVRALGITQPLDFDRRLRALKAFTGTAAAASLAAANKRTRNILKQAAQVSESVDPAHFEHSAEQALYSAMQALQAQRPGSYAEQLSALAALKAPVDAFFEGVMVMADQPAVRANRLALLSQLDRMCRQVADLSQLPG